MRRKSEARRIVSPPRHYPPPSSSTSRPENELGLQRESRFHNPKSKPYESEEEEGREEEGGEEESGEEEGGEEEESGEEEGREEESEEEEEGYREEDGDRLGVDEEECADFASQFAEARKEDNVEGDSDSGEDICNDDIPEPVSSDEDEDDIKDVGERNEVEEEGVFLRLGKTFNTKEDVKIAVLRYSLKSKYDIKLYISEYNKVGARCSDKRCPWRMYYSYERRLRRMQIKVFIDNHTCLKSGRNVLLKQKTIVWLFKDRLRKNPKLKPREMSAKILREYGLLVTNDQCAKAKTRLARKRREGHLEHFERIWDYQAEVLQSNNETMFEIETLPGHAIGSKQRFYRLFICFDAQQRAWKETCRPIIGLDRAFLKWDVRGHLIATV